MTEPLIEVEQSTLGAAMLSKIAAETVCRVLEPVDFYDPKHEVIMGAIVRLRSEKNPTDVVAVVDHLIHEGLLSQAGGPEYIHQLTSVVPSAANADYYAGIVREAAVARGLTGILARGQDAVVRGDSPGKVLASTIHDLGHLRDISSSRHTPLRSLGEVLNVDPAVSAYDWTVRGLLERKDRLVVTGPEGGGKSVFLRQLAICAAAGVHPMTQQQCQAMRVLVIDAENSEKQWQRQVVQLADTAWQLGVEDPRKTLAPSFVSGMNLARTNDLSEIHQWMDEWKPDLVVLGPLYKLSGGMNNDEEAKPILDALDTIRERNVSIIIEGHAGHADSRSQTRDMRPIGSSALLRWPEFGFGLVKPQNTGDPFPVQRWRGDREDRAWPTRMTAKRYQKSQRLPWEPTPDYWATEGAQALMN
jgi:hypothetical protein